MGDAGREFVCLLPLKKETLERVGERTDTTQHTEALKGGQRVVGRFWRPLAGNLWGISGIGCGEAGGRSGQEARTFGRRCLLCNILSNTRPELIECLPERAR